MKLSFSKKQNEIFPDIILYLTLYTLIIILLLAFALTSIFRENMLTQSYRHSVETLTNISSSAAIMDDYGKGLIKQFFYNNTLFRLGYSSLTTIEEVESLYALHSQLTSLSLAHSIYVYNGTRDIFYTTLPNSAISAREDFFDQDLVALLESNESYLPARMISRSLIKGEGDASYTPEGSHIFSYIYCEKINDKINMAIVINLSTSWLNKVVTSISSNNSTNIFITDQNGVVISSNLEEALSASIQSTVFYRKMTAENKSSGYMLEKVNGVPTLITYARQEGSSPLIFWDFIPVRTITKKLNVIYAINFFVSIVILIIGYLLFLNVSKRITSPIQEQLRKLNHLTEENKRLRHRKTDYLHKLLTTPGKDILNYMYHSEKDYGLSIDLHQSVGIILIHPFHKQDIIHEIYQDSEELFTFSLCNVVQELFLALYPNEVFHVTGDRYCILYNPEEGSSQDQVIATKELLSRIKVTVLELLRLELLCCIGPVISLYENATLHDSFQTVHQVEQYRLFFSKESILDYKDFPSRTDYSFPHKELDSFKEDLFQYDSEKTAAHLHTLLSIDYTQYPLAFFESILMRITFIIQNLVEKMNSLNSLNLEFEFLEFVGSLNRFESIGQLEQRLTELCTSLLLQINDRIAYRHVKIIEQLKELIQNQYSDSTLSLDGLADQFGFSPVYLGRIFKAQTLTGFSEYLMNVRLERAVFLLETTDQSINEIVSNVGFTNRSYFQTLFKKKFGVTPSAYSRQLKQ